MSVERRSSEESSREWVQRRREAVAAQAQRLARAHDAETAQALALVAAFVQEARRVGLAAELLRAVAPSGATYRTGARGWVLRRDGRTGIGDDGCYYLLSAPSGLLPHLRGRLRGVALVPSDPPLVLGRGGRDGDSIPLADLLTRRLAGPPSAAPGGTA